MRKNLTRILFGIILIFFGVGYLLKMSGVWPDFTLFFEGWWLLFIIIPSMFSIINDGIGVFNVAAFIVSVAVLLSKNGFLPFEIGVPAFAGIILIAIGLQVIFGSKLHRLTHTKSAATTGIYYNTNEKTPEYNISFRGEKVNFDGKEFCGLKSSVSFGNLDIDLRGAKIAHDVDIIANVSFGGMTIFIPDNICFDYKNETSFGSVENHHKNPDASGLPTVYLTGSCSFGAIIVK